MHYVVVHVLVILTLVQCWRPVNGRIREGPYLMFSHNYPRYIMGIQNTNQAFIVDYSSGTRFFIVTPGLEGTEGTISFESDTKPGHYLRHAGYVMWLHPYENKALYRADATFWPKDDKFYPDTTAYESFNYPNHFVRHTGYRLRISRYDGTELLRKDASFKSASGLPQEPIVTKSGPWLFHSFNYPTYTMGVKPRNEAHIVNDFRKDSFYLVSPGLAGAKGSVSFESKTKPGFYLRHAGYVMWLHPLENTRLYREDATYWPKGDIFYRDFDVYESFNYPNHYVRHFNYRLRISKEDHSTILRKDASFQKTLAREGPYFMFSHNYPRYIMGIQNTNQAFIVDYSSGTRFFIVTPGLEGVEGTISFESETHPGHYLRHAGYVMWLHPYEDKALYRADATFWPKNDIFYPDFTAYESFNYPNHFVRHSGYRLRISRDDDTRLLRQDASFKSVSMLPQEPIVTKSGPWFFYSFNYPAYTMGVKQRNEAHIVNDFRKASFYLVSPGLAGAKGSVSFESKTKPGFYLRHSGYVMWLHPLENTRLYREDATYWPRKDMFYQDYDVYESFNYRNHYVRHSNYRLRISREDHSTILRRDASFEKKQL